MIKSIHRLFFSVVCLMCVLTTSTQAANTVIQFNPVPNGLASRLVYNQWMKEAEYKDYTDFMQSPPHYMIAQGDINDDGVAEIFARHSDSDLDYCPGFGTECRLHIYKLVKGQLIEIGRMYSSKDVIVKPQVHLGYHDLSIARAGKKMWSMCGMANDTKRSKFFLTCVFCVTAAVTWACPGGSYVSPPNPATANRDYGARDCTGCSTFHAGWDEGTDQGKTTIGGVVTTKADNGGLGNTVIVTNGNFRTIYGHACSLNSSLNGTTVGVGQSLGNWSSCCTGNCSSGSNTCMGATTANPCSAGMHVHYETQVRGSNGEWSAVDPAIVRDMVAAGRDPCDPSFADEAINRTISKHGHLANGADGAGGNSSPTTTTPAVSSGAGMCV